MGEDSGEKTEEPTPHKLQEARKKGQIAKSKDLTTAVMVLVSFYMLKNSAGHMWANLIQISYKVYDQIPLEFTVSIAGSLLMECLKVFFVTLAPILGANFLTALIVEVSQTGFLISLGPIEPKLEKLNPIEGFKKYFSMKTYVELLKSSIKMFFVVWLIYGVIRDNMFMVIIAQQLNLWQMMEFTGSIVMQVVTRVGIFYLFVALFDYMYQRYEYNKGLKMSKKEIKDEYKRLEGDPMIKQRQKDAQRQMSQGRQMGAVPNADVVVTNPIHLAIAMQYEPNAMKAPKIVAKGRRLVAQEIKRIALENHIPIIENPPLAQTLYKGVDVDSEIPAQYYKAVAEILAFVYNLKKKKKRKY